MAKPPGYTVCDAHACVAADSAAIVLDLLLYYVPTL
jgi:hypothetical protein